MKKTATGLYKCGMCGKKFENAKRCRNHEETCGVSSLDEFTDQTESGTSNLEV